MSSYIFEQVEEAVQQVVQQKLEQLLRPYLPESYFITVDKHLFGDYTITIENTGGAYITIDIEEDYIDTISLGDGTTTGLDNDINETDLGLDDIVDNIKEALALVEQDELDDAMKVLTTIQSEKTTLMIINQATIAPFIPGGYQLSLRERDDGNTGINIECEYSNNMKYLLTITIDERQTVQYLGFAVYNLRATPAYMSSRYHSVGNWRVPVSSILPRIAQAITYLEREEFRQAFQHLI